MPDTPAPLRSADSYGALGPEGPPGHKGPVADEQYYGEADPGKALFESNDFAPRLTHVRLLGGATALPGAAVNASARRAVADGAIDPVVMG